MLRTRMCHDGVDLESQAHDAEITRSRRPRTATQSQHPLSASPCTREVSSSLCDTCARCVRLPSESRSVLRACLCFAASVPSACFKRKHGLLRGRSRPRSVLRKRSPRVVGNSWPKAFPPLAARGRSSCGGKGAGGSGGINVGSAAAGAVVKSSVKNAMNFW